MFGGHGHSHGNGQQCNHNHGGGSGVGGASKLNVGFDDDEEEEIKQKRQAKMQNLNMQQMMMANAMKAQMAASGGGEGKAGGMMPAHPMMMHGGMMPKMNPKMMEVSKKMIEQRQQMMKEFIEKGGESNPEAMQEMMKKAQELQRSAMLQMQEAMAEGGSEASDDTTSIPMPSVTGGANLLNADLNNSKLDDLINPSNLKKNKKAKNEQEAKILDSINRKDYSDLTAVKATQYGVLERLKELIESGQTDPHKPDAENVYLLHWAAINNRIEIAKYLLSLKVSIDPIGGELESTPLNWAARSGHIQMVVFLVQNGANPMTFDVEGFSTIHLSTMFGHSIVTAYLLAKGLDPDMKDKNGVTPLMFAAQRIHSRDPAQLLLTFSARMNVQDTKGNTPLHYCVAFNNVTVMKILLEKGASLDIKNHKGLDPVEFAIDRGKGSAASMMRMSRDEDKNSLPSFLRSIGKNKEMRKQGTRFYPFFLIFYFGMVFDASVSLYFKLFLIALFYGVSFSFNKVFFDKNVLDIIPFATTCAIIFWCYVTYILYFFPVVFQFDLGQIFFWFCTGMSWYCLYKCFKTDPGLLTSNHDQMNQTIIKFVEQDAFSLDQFCTVCIIRKPLRSKHCSSCDRCVAKFDHHCPWVDNCVGQNNLKYFLGFVFWTPICLAHFLWGAFKWYETMCYQTDMVAYPEMSSFRLFVNFVYCSPWVGWITGIVCLNTFWISCLCICHIYQIIFAALTTNERLNAARYKHFYDDNGNWKNPYNFGPIQNFVDLLEMQLFIFKPTFINWKKEYNIEDIKDLRTNRIKRAKAENQIV